MAKLDAGGNLITSEIPLKMLYLQTYKNRMKHDVIKDTYIEIYNLKMKLWSIMYENLRSRKTPGWTPDNIRSAVMSLKNNKSMCPLGFINELLKEAVQTEEFLFALTHLMNGIKCRVRLFKHSTDGLL